MKRLVLLMIAYTFAVGIRSQELEPRAYANLPTGTNALVIAYGLSKGNVLTDPSLPIGDFKITAHNLGLGYARTFGLFQRLARVQVVTPFIFMSGQLKLNGRDTSGVRNGFGDTRIRLGINLIGSPALSPKDFRAYQQKTIVGFSLVFSVPTGLYYEDKRINLGSNRWAFKPEVGVSKRFKRFYAEAYSGIWVYTDNKKFLESKSLTQDPVFSIQGHINYYFKNQMWIGTNVNWFNGGRTFVDNAPSGDLKDNWRVGGIFSMPIAPKHSIKFQFHVGAFTATGYNYKLAAISYQYVFF